MARKSRKQNLGATNIRETGMGKVRIAAGYIRLSVTKENRPPESVENQRRSIKQLITHHPDIILEKFYVDAPASGTHFERKAFQEMIDDINNGKINCVVVGDLSRLGRDSIETGFYLEQYFPSKGVRFISIRDRFDTIDGVTNISFDKMSGLKIPITNIFNEKVVEDIRSKTQSSIDCSIREGKFVAPRAPYGYKKALNDCHALILDTGADLVVKEIFNMAYNKVGLNEIARRLNASSIPTPIDYARANGLQGNYKQGNGLWNTRTIKYILTNRIYAGDLEQGKERVVVQNTHEAIVSRDMFDGVQSLLKSSSDKSNTATNTPRPDNILKSKVICGSCGGKMQRRKGSGKSDWYFFTCISKNRLGVGHCEGMYIRESEIMDAISSEIRQYVGENEIKSFADSGRMEKLEEKIAYLNDCVQTHQGKLRSQYEAHIQGFVAVQNVKLASEVGERLQLEIDAAESNIEILGKEQKQYNLFRSALQNKSYVDELIDIYLQKAIVRDGRRVEVSFHP